VLAAAIGVAVAALLAFALRADLAAMVDTVILRLREAGPVVFFVAMAVLPAGGFPLLAFTLAAGPVFGPTLGAGWVVACSLASVSCNLLLSYWVGLRALQPAVRRLLRYFGVGVPHLEGGNGWQLALIVRLTPGPPFWLQSYLLAVVGVPLIPYLVVSILVMAGYIVALVCGGAAIAQGNGRLAVVAVSILVVSVAALMAWRKRLSRRSQDHQLRSSAPGFTIAFEANPSRRLDVGLPVLAGDGIEELFGAARPVGRSGSLTLYTVDGWLLGVGTAPRMRGLEEATAELYRDVFAAADGRQLARIWHYIPGINDTGSDGLERYQVFCRGRSLAFEQRYGRQFKALLPAASAVGTMSDALTIVFAASPTALRHVENPRQIPAYDYPREHGPRAPAFARATVALGPGRARIFISGTAAIRGHATVAPYDIAGQLECTMENLRTISSACSLGDDLDRAGDSTRSFKVYLRRAADQPLAAAALVQHFLRATDRVSYLQADICRAPLLVEIEVTLFDVACVERSGRQGSERVDVNFTARGDR